MPNGGACTRGGRTRRLCTSSRMQQAPLFAKGPRLVTAASREQPAAPHPSWRAIPAVRGLLHKPSRGLERGRLPTTRSGHRRADDAAPPARLSPFITPHKIHRRKSAVAMGENRRALCHNSVGAANECSQHSNRRNSGPADNSAHSAPPLGL